MPELDTLDLPEVVYADGAEILSEGERHGLLLILVSGTVRVTSAGAEISTINQPGSLFGEMAILLDGPATATVTAVGECRFLRSDDPQALMRARPDFAMEVAVTLAQRLDLITRYLADLRNQYSDRSDHLGVVDAVLGSLLQHQTSDLQTGSEREPEAPY